MGNSIINILSKAFLSHHALLLNDLRDEGLRVMDECPSDYNSSLLELLSFFGLCIGHSSHKEQYNHWLTSIITLPTSKGSLVVRLLDFVLDELRQDVLEEIGSMLGIYTWHVLENSIEITQCLFL